MPMTADQAKQAVTQAVLDGVQNITAAMTNACAANGENGAGYVQSFEAGLSHLRQMEATAHRIVDKAFDAKAEEPDPASAENDEDYRQRLARTVGAWSIHSGKLATAFGRVLDEIGEHYSLKRK